MHRHHMSAERTSGPDDFWLARNTPKIGKGTTELRSFRLALERMVGKTGTGGRSFRRLYPNLVVHGAPDALFET